MDARHAELRQHARHEHYGGDTPYEVIKVLEAWLTPEEFIGFCNGRAIAYGPTASRRLVTDQLRRSHRGRTATRDQEG